MSDLEIKRAQTLEAWEQKEDTPYKAVLIESFEQPKKQSPYWRAFHWFNLITNIVGGAVIGPVSVFLPCKKYGLFVNLAWRYMPMTLWLIAAVTANTAYMYFFNVPIEKLPTDSPKKKYLVKDMMKDKEYHLLVWAASLCQIIIQVGIVWATLHTIQADASILTNCYGAVLVMFYIIICKKLHLFEYIGTFCICAFVVLICCDPKSLRVGESSPNIVNSFLCLLVNIPFVIYFMIIRRLGQIVGNTMVYVLHQTIIQCCMIAAFAIYFDNAEWNTLNDNSIWGWLQKDQVVYVSVLYGLVCGVYGTHGAIFAVKHFPLVPLMNSYLSRPIIAQLLGCLLKIDHIPGPLTFIGVAGLIISIVFQKKGEVLRQQKDQKILDKINRPMNSSEITSNASKRNSFMETFTSRKSSKKEKKSKK